jgi:hypothetical protein
MESFGYQDIEDLFNVKRTRLAQWMKRGYLKPPSIQSAGTPGRANLYSRQDLYSIGLFSYLTIHSQIVCERAAEIVSYVNFEKETDSILRIAGVPFLGAAYPSISRGEEGKGINLEKEISSFELNIEGLKELIDIWIERLSKEKE